MSLRSKVFLVIGTVLVVCFFAIYQSLSRIIERDFSVLEQREAVKNLSRMTDTLGNKMEELSIKLSDWAQWDDMYQYAVDHNEAFIRSNLPDTNSAFTILHLNFVVIADKEGKFLYKRYVQNGEEKPFPKSFEEHLIEDGATEYLVGPHKELVCFPEGCVLYAAKPITSSDGLSPTRGYVIFGYMVDETTIQELSQLTHLDISFAPYDEKEGDTGFVLARQHLSREQSTFIAPPSSSGGNTLSGYALVSDVEGNPVLILRVNMARDIDRMGQDSIVLFAKFLVGAAALFGILIFFIMNRLVLHKLSLLSGQVEKIGESGNAGGVVSLPGKDEFSKLAEKINNMLSSLYEMERKKKESEGRFRTVADAAPVMIWMMDAEKKCTYVNKVWLDFTGRSLEEELGTGWAEKIHPDDLKKGMAIFEEAFRRQEPFAVEYRMRRFDGTDRWMFMRCIPNMGGEGVFSGYLGSAVDISERKQTEEQQQIHTEEIETMNRLMVERELKMIELKEKIKELEGHA